MFALKFLCFFLLFVTICTECSPDNSIRPYKINIPENVLVDLKDRLNKSRLDYKQISSAGWKYGTNSDYLKELVHYWRDSYDWRKAETLLNQFPQFTTEIDGLQIHFIHKKAPRSNKSQHTVPLLFVHGWPGSFMECSKIIDLLTVEKDELTFDVVCPSLPGYGFSDQPTEAGWDTSRIASAFATLMGRLGYSQYIAQGGDWGFLISTKIALLDPEHCKGIHINLVLMTPFNKGVFASIKTAVTLLFPSFFYTDQEYQSLKRTFYDFVLSGSGYAHIQGTRPDSVGPALNDSPAGLAAYIIEKFYEWGDCGGNIESRFTKDELITNLMIYWTSQSVTSSMRLYYEEISRVDPSSLRDLYVSQPVAYAKFPGDIYCPPRSWIEYFYNVVHYTELPRGGHFAALEEPELLVNDIRSFIKKLLSLAPFDVKESKKNFKVHKEL